ncbi:MAG: hypothetical protein OQJ74_02420, partial [Ignavibacteriaceae bacterium]|nr:hypothetical protein [Ignavibacteriaceae bacterium]
MNLKYFFSGILTILIFLVFPNTSIFAQLSGTYTIPGTPFATIQAAIDSLNQVGVGTGGVAFNITAGHTETFTSDSAGNITTTGTASDPIIFQKSGAGANPLITASGLGTIASSTTNGADGDGIIFIDGGDYITFDAIDLQENVAATGDQFMEYGYYLKKASGDDACKNVTIKNCTITLDKATIYSYGIYISNKVGSNDATVTSTGGRTEDVKVFSCSISDCYGGIQVRGDAASAPYDFYDQNIEIGVDGGNSITDFGGGGSSCYVIYAIYQNNLKIANNTINGGTGSTSLMYGIYTSTGNNSNIDIYSNTVTVTSDASSSSVYCIYNLMGSSGTDNTINIYDNIIENISSTSTGTWYILYNNGSAFTVNIYGNTIRNVTRPGSGTTYLLRQYNTASDGTENVYNNNIYNNTNGTSSLYCLYSYPTSSTTKYIHNNNIYSNTGGSTIYTLYDYSGTASYVYENNIYNIESTTTSSSVLYGIYCASGTDHYYYNNFISDVKAPNSTSTAAGTRGIYLSSGTNIGLYYNTVYLDYTAAAGNISAVFYPSTSPTSIDLRNNIFVNNVDNSAGADAIVFRGGGTATLTDLAATTNNNLYYAGTPSATNLIYYDGTNTAQTLGEYQALVSPLELSSVTSLPPFVNTTTPPYDLHIDPTTPTQTESGGTPVTTPIAITTDYDGDTRNVSTPDIGADEFDGIGADLTPPDITYDILPNVSSTQTSVTLTATITDASGIAGGANLPRLYIKKTTDVSYVFDNNPSIAGDDYTFTINYSAIGGISIGDTIEYYVAAQDVNDNVATNPPGGSGINPPGTTPPPSPNTYLVVDVPLSGIYTVGLAAFKNATGKNVYFETRTRTVAKKIQEDPFALNEDQTETKTEIVSQDLSPKNITVTETYKVLMENGKPFDTKFFQSPESMGVYPTLTAAINDLNLRGVSGPVEFSLVDTFYPNETYPILIGEVVGVSQTNTVTIKPATGIQAEIPGDISQTQPTIYCYNTDWLIVDGSNTPGGTTKDLKIVGLTNESVASSIYLEEDADNNVFKNLILESQETSTGFGTFVFGPGPLDSNTVQNCTVKNIDSIAYKPRVGVYTYSTNTGTGNQIIDCSVYDWYTYGIRLQGAPSANTLVSGCDIYQTSPGTASPYGIYISRVDGLIVEKCKITELMGTSTIRGVYYFGSSTSGDAIFRNNFISLSGSTNLTSGSIYGLDYFAYAANNFEAYHNSIYIGGTDVTTGSSYALTKRDDANIYKAYDNAVYNARSNSTGTGTHYAVYVGDTNTVTLEIDYNDFFADGTGGTFGYYQGPGALADLATWQTATGMDANSVSGDPGYVGNDDLHIQSSFNTLDGNGLYFASIPDDIDGDIRNMTTPDIGADEYTYVFLISAPTNLVAIPDTFTVDLSWQDNSNNEMGFVIERKDGDSLSVNPFNPIDTVAADTIHYLDTGLSANTTYTYRVYGYNTEGNSAYSNLAEATTFIPVELTSFTAEINERDVMIKWETATETNNQGFDIERRTDSEWEKIGFKDGKGSTTEPTTYSFVDKFTYKSYKGTITYRLRQMDFDGTYEYSNEIEVDADFTPKEYTLYQNYPNPFNPTTTIKFSLPFESNVQITVYNILGELVDVVVDELKEVGFHNYVWNASNLTSGIYIYTIDAKAVDG